jgi:hypothetical protein
METNKVTITTLMYHYECKECENDFWKKHPVAPIVCYNCNSIGTIHEDIVEVKKEKNFQRCPICNQFFETSSFLKEIFDSPHTLWLANMVTHYRHNHIASWNKMWGRNGVNYTDSFMSNPDKKYEQLKRVYNERAKRQILRKCKDYLISNGFKVEHIIMLQNTDEKTIALYSKFLGK